LIFLVTVHTIGDSQPPIVIMVTQFVTIGHKIGDNWSHNWWQPTTRLEEGERSIVLQSFTEGGGDPTYLTSGEGVEETLIIEFGIKWMKATTDALQDKKEEDEDPNQPIEVPDLPTFFSSTYTFLNGDM